MLGEALIVVILDEASNFSCCWRRFFAGGLVLPSSRSDACAHGAVLLGLPGLMRSMPMPKRSHHTESLERPKKRCGWQRYAVVGADRQGQPKVLKSLSNTVNANISWVVPGHRTQQVTARKVGDGQRIAIPLIGEHELTL